MKQVRSLNRDVLTSGCGSGCQARDDLLCSGAKEEAERRRRGEQEVLVREYRHPNQGYSLAAQGQTWGFVAKRGAFSSSTWTFHYFGELLGLLTPGPYISIEQFVLFEQDS